MIKQITVKIEDRINHNPDFDKLGHIGYTARESGRTAGWRGCPLGRGPTKDSAIGDLLRRANAESGTTYRVRDLDILDASKGPEAYVLGLVT